MHHKEILLSEPGRNTNVGENAFIPELPLYVDMYVIEDILKTSTQNGNEEVTHITCMVYGW